MGRINYTYDDDLHERAKVAAIRKGQTLKDWVGRAILAAVEQQEAEWERRQRQRR
jgi:predicted HicB family RNase H-like nuclease